MTAHTVAEAFADAAARLTGRADASGSLLALLRDCATLMEVDSVGLLIKAQDESFDLLSSTSHTAGLLELYELQTGSGPCVDAVLQNVAIAAAMPDLAHRWLPVGPAIREAGYLAVQAYPLRWHGRAVGAINLFGGSATRPDADRAKLGQAFANMAVAVLAQPLNGSWTSLQQRVTQILGDRSMIEQAKGVLAVQHGIGLADAFALLVDSALAQRIPLRDHAAHVLDGVRTPFGDSDPPTA